MLISRQKRFLFVHIQKTAGRSLSHTLEASVPDLQSFLGTHDTALQARQWLGAETYDSFFTAAFVRNPWDRLVSWYTMIVQKSARRPWWWKLFGRHRYQLWRYVVRNSRSFEEFVLRCTAEIDDGDGLKSFCRNQVDYLVDERGRPIVDFVGRFEYLDSDARRLFRRLGLVGVRLPHINLSHHHHYSAYYSDELAEVVRRRYARDIDAFGYEFVRWDEPGGGRDLPGRQPSVARIPHLRDESVSTMPIEPPEQNM
jgi:hypothetical protein